ncbi:hypothetical protein FRC04_006002 [Tulasnella sp. 424]|nr:hypothetical protein FRC04_006002 [Tulasnella sp. 424]KAG8975592.1 hypothetical protein FRC05_005385 [Tulasnella sp. 425]
MMAPDNVNPLPALLSTLKALIKQLPPSCPRAPKNGPVHINFSNLDVPDGENAYYVIDQTWTRAFQCKSNVAIGGRYGVGVVYDFFVHFSKQDLGTEMYLLALRIERFIGLVKDVLGENPSASSDSTVVAPTEAQAVEPDVRNQRGSTSNIARSDDDEASSVISQELDQSFDTRSDESDEVVEISRPSQTESKRKSAGLAKKTILRKPGANLLKKQAKPRVPLSKEAKIIKEKKTRMQTKAIEKHKQARGKTPLSGSSGDERESENEVPKVSAVRKSTISLWAFAHWTLTPANQKGCTIWVWTCNWCEAIRTTPRTSGVKDYSNETLDRPLVSNFSSHLKSNKCKIPAKYAYGANVPSSKSETLSTTTSEPQSVFKLAPEAKLGYQQQIMHDFTVRAKEEPAPTFSREGFRLHLVKAIIRDGLPFAFTEGSGIKQLFKYSMPAITLPSRHTIRRDLDVLYGVLREKLKERIKALTSQCATSSDVWSSRNSAFAFLGTKIFWISDKWALESHVLDLIHLGEGHSGAITGKLMFSALVEYDAAIKMTNVADNTSSNQVHNRALSKRRRKAFQTDLESPPPDVSNVGCAGHVVHLVAQELLSHFGMALPVDEVDYYIKYNRRHGLVYTAETDLELLAEEEQEAARFEAEERKAKRATRDTRSNQLNQESVDDTDSEWEDELVSGEGVGDRGAARSKTPNLVEKVHELITHINRSAIQQSKFRGLVVKYCSPEFHKLGLMKGMDVRWNSRYAELKRAKQLRAALDQYVGQLEEGKTGKKLKTARERRLRCSGATVELSRADVPTLPMVLPLYKAIEAKLEEGKEAAQRGGSETVICEDAFDAALVKLVKYIMVACSSELHLLVVVLHPSYRVSWFKDKTHWDSTGVATRARVLITQKYSEYAEKYAAQTFGADGSLGGATQSARKSSGLLADTISHRVSREANLVELDSYLRDTFPCTHYDDVLDWWKKHEGMFPILARLARDMLAIPGVSISVERLFSVCRHVITESRSSMTANTARMTICAKEWLTEGLGDDVVILPE